MSSHKKIMLPVLAVFGTAGTLALTAAVLFAAGVVPVHLAGAAPADIPSDTLGVGLRIASLGGAGEGTPTGKVAFAGSQPPESMLKPGTRAQAPPPKPKPAPKPAPAPKSVAKPAPAPAPSRSGDDGAWQSAKASWYGPGFYGRTTASGAVLTQGMMNVAHKTLPFGTRIQFEYNGRTATAVVNDRGPHVAGRVFDLGPGTASALGFGGVATVKYRILGR